MNDHVQTAPQPTPSAPGAEGKVVETEIEHTYNDGYILDASQLSPGSSVKVAPDGRTVLIPQPSDDPDDPLNWSQRKKHIILAVVCACTFLPDYGSATGAVTLIPQGAYVSPELLALMKSGTDDAIASMASARTKSITPSPAINSWLALVASLQSCSPPILADYLCSSGSWSLQRQQRLHKLELMVSTVFSCHACSTASSPELHRGYIPLSPPVCNLRD